MITREIRTAEIARSTLDLGMAGENNRTEIRIDCSRELSEFPGAVPALTVKPPAGDPYPVVTSRDGNAVIWLVSASDTASTSDKDAYGEFQLAFSVDGRIAKTYTGKTVIHPSLGPAGSVPSVIENWIIEANAALGTIEGAMERSEAGAAAAIAAQGKAEDAQEAAEAAQRKAETAQGKAEDAQTAAETAQVKAEDAQEAAEASASSASADAERAEQAANTLGYLEMEIENGHLIYRKTELIETDFKLEDGHLIMEVA